MRLRPCIALGCVLAAWVLLPALPGVALTLLTGMALWHRWPLVGKAEPLRCLRGYRLFTYRTVPEWPENEDPVPMGTCWLYLRNLAVWAVVLVVGNGLRVAVEAIH